MQEICSRDGGQRQPPGTPSQTCGHGGKQSVHLYPFCTIQPFCNSINFFVSDVFRLHSKGHTHLIFLYHTFLCNVYGMNLFILKKNKHNFPKKYIVKYPIPTLVPHWPIAPQILLAYVLLSPPQMWLDSPILPQKHMVYTVPIVPCPPPLIKYFGGKKIFWNFGGPSESTYWEIPHSF